MILKNREVYRLRMLAYTQITKLQYEESLNTNSIITKIIDSKWFIWQGEKYPKGMTWHYESKPYYNVRMHGHYDANMLEINDFKEISKESVIDILCNYIHKNIGEDIQYINKIQNLLKDLIEGNTEYYQLKISDDDKISKFNIYSFFISFLVLNVDKQEVTLIEFGQD